MESRNHKLAKSNIIFVALILTLNLVFILNSGIILIKIFYVQTYPLSFLIAFVIWFLGVIFLVICIIIGSYLFFRYGKIINRFLFSYLILAILAFKVSNTEFSWFIIRLAITFGISSVSIGINFAGIPLLVWYLIFMVKKQHSSKPIQQYNCLTHP